jgi:hypothetical protein
MEQSDEIEDKGYLKVPRKYVTETVGTLVVINGYRLRVKDIRF